MANLPEDTLKQVFKLFAGFKRYSYKNWAQQLVLLSVCQRWRHCALPLVCQHAGFYFERPGKEDVEFESIEDRMDTNLDKVMAIGHPNMIRNLNISIDYNIQAFESIMYVLNIMGSQLPVWSSLREIRIESMSGIPNNNTTAEAWELARINNTIIDNIIEIMPNIVNLEIRDYFNYDVSKMLYGRLASLYAQNLKTLIFHKQVPLDDINVFSRLTNLQVGCENNPSIILPLAHIDVLECLKLQNLSESMQWYNFAQNQSSKVVFRSLRILGLRYIVSENSSTLSSKTVAFPELHFPKLQSLTIFNLNERLQLLSYFVLKSELDIMNITASISSLRLLTRIKLPSIKRLSLGTSFRNNTHSGSLSSAFDVLCNVAKYAQIIDDMQFHITNSVHIDLTGCNVYPPLTCLSICNFENYAHVLSLVQHLPCLKKLIMTTIYTDNINLGELETLLGDQQGVAPISTSVEYVSVTYDNNFSSNIAIMFNMYLLVGMPALGELSVWEIDHDKQLEVINKYKARYPHLENVKITSE